MRIPAIATRSLFRSNPSHPAAPTDAAWAELVIDESVLDAETATRTCAARSATSWAAEED